MLILYRNVRENKIFIMSFLASCRKDLSFNHHVAGIFGICNSTLGAAEDLYSRKHFIFILVDLIFRDIFKFKKI